MSQSLIDLNADLRKLRAEGYNIAIEAAHLVARDIPYVGPSRQVHCDGILITNLDLSGNATTQPSDHQIWFAGQQPHKADGNVYASIRPNPGTLNLHDRLQGNFHFSAKPREGRYRDYYHKISTYAALLTKEALQIDPEVSPRTRRVFVPDENDKSPFNYLDTASARAEINAVTAKLAVDKIAIVGLGGTGSYVLDLISKTPVQEIHLFDGDVFSSHNAFRAPGAPSLEALHAQPQKVDHFASIYSNMHSGIIPHNEYLDESNVESLRGMSAVFLCIDGGPTKRMIVERLEEFNIPFFDTGIGLYEKNETLGGILQLTTSTTRNRDQARRRISFADAEAENPYAKNIQVADLNALNATLAVIRWKKTRGFYFDHNREHFSAYTIGTGRLLNEDCHEQD